VWYYSEVGKYSKVTKDLPRLPEALTGRVKEVGGQEAVDAAKVKLKIGRGSPHGLLIQQYLDTRRQLDRSEAVVKSRKARVAAAEQLMWAGMEQARVRAGKTEDGRGCYIKDEPQVEVTDHAAVREWALGNAFRERLQLPWPTLNAEVKERLLNGDPIPPGVNLYCKWTTVPQGNGTKAED
jgi:hypothetical protein